MAPKFPYKAAKVVTQAVPVGEASDAAKALAKYWETGADEHLRSVAWDKILETGRDVSGAVSTPADSETRRLWKVYNELPLPSTVPADRSHFDPPGTLIQQNAPLTDKVMPPLSDVDARSATRQRIRDAQEAQRYGPGLTEGTDLIGAAATVGAGALALSAGSAQAEEFWTPERLAKFQAKTKEQKQQILEKLTDAEFQELKAKLRQPTVAPSGPVDYSQYMPKYVPEVPGQFTPGTATPTPTVGERILGGVTEALDPRNLLKGSPIDVANNAVLGPLAQVPEVAEAIVQPVKEEYLNPAIAEWQKGNREDLGAGADPEALDKLVGPAGAQALRNLGSVVYGPPETYRTPEQQLAGQQALAKVGEKWLNFDMTQPRAAVSEATVGGALANTFTEQAAYLPLYLIPGFGKSSAVQGATGGFLSDLVDPRKEANPVRAAQAGSMFGGLLGEVAPAVWREVKALRGTEVEKWAGKGDAAVIPAKEVKALVDAPTQETLKSGAKASYTEARASQHGGIEMRPVQVTQTGKKAGAWERVGPNGTLPGKVRGPVVAASDEVAAQLPGADAIVPRQYVNAIDEGDVLVKQGDRYVTAFGEDEVLPLHHMPEGDFLVARFPVRREGATISTDPAEFRRVKVQNLQTESLRRRELAVVNTPEGPRFGFLRHDENGRAFVAAPDPAEKIPGALSQSSDFASADVRIIRSTDEFRDVLGRRDAALAAEREAVANSADAQIAAEAGPAGVPVIDTPAGPKVALTGDDIKPPAPPPEGPPPGFPPGSGFGGVPMPPKPPNPALVGGLYDQVDLVQKALSPLVIPPTASGALDASTAATWFASSRNADALQGRIELASEAVLRPVFSKLPPAKQAAIRKDAEIFLEGRMEMPELLKKHPEIEGEIAVMTAEARARAKANQAYLESQGFVHPTEIPAPSGLKNFAEELKNSRAYLARRYYAYELKAGKWREYLVRNEKQYDALVDEYLNAVLMKDKKLEGLSPSELRDLAKDKLDLVLRDPDALAEEWNRVQGGSGLKRGDASDALKAKAGAGLEEAMLLFNKRKETMSSDQLSAALDYVATGKNFDDMVKHFPGVEGKKDIDFLKDLKARWDSDLPKWMKMALGPIESPWTRSAFTVSAQEDLMMRARAIDLLTTGGHIQSEADLAALRPSAVTPDHPERWIPIPNDPSRYGKAAGQRVHPNYAGFLYYTEMTEGMGKFAAFLNKLGKGMKIANTVMSQGAWFANVMGNVTGMMASGALSPTDLFRPGGAHDVFSSSWKHWDDFLKRPNAISATGPTGADWIRDAVKYGIVGTDMVSSEFRSSIEAMAKKSFPSEMAKTTLVDWVSAAFDGVKAKAGGAMRTYGGIDPFFKHANWLAGLKKGGVDLKTGTLADRTKAIKWLEGWGGSADQLNALSDAQLVERVKAGSARMIAESHPMPDRSGRIQRETAKIADVTGVLGVGDLFARTASEVVRTYAMIPYRAFNRPGVAKSIFEWGLLAGGAYYAVQSQKRRMGIDEATERQSFMGLPPSLRKWRPGAYALPFKHEDGRLSYLDMGRIFDPVKWFSGDPGGRPLMEGLSESPGHMATLAGLNVASSYFGIGRVPNEAARAGLEAAGLLPQSPADPTLKQPGAWAFTDKLWKLAAPGFAKQGVMSMNSLGGSSPVTGGDAAAQFLSGGLVFPGGTPADAAKQSQMLMRDQQKAMRPNPYDREGKQLGPFQTFSRDKANQLRQEKVQEINKYRR